jgi:GNAT superfamily N-acetyltransferase
VSDCIAQQDFDTEAFQVPFYRVVRVEPESLSSELDALVDRSPIIIDAKLPAEDVQSARLLLERGFRKVCTQLELRHDLAEAPVLRGDARVSDRIDVSEDRIAAHAENFTCDRFSLDPLLDPQGGKRLYRNWIRNSLSGRRRVAHLGEDFCTFSEPGSGASPHASIDLLSVLSPGKGVGSELVSTVVARARDAGLSHVSVVTECENERAWRLYMRCGFRVARFYSALHFVNR